MAWTIDRSSGVDSTIPTSVTSFFGNPTTTIFQPGTAIASLILSAKGPSAGLEWFSGAAASVAALNGNGASDRLIGGSAGNLVVWDSASLDGVTYDGGASPGRARLPFLTADARIEIFDLGGGNDIINLTASSAANINGASPGNYIWAATVYGGLGSDRIAAGEAGDLIYGDDAPPGISDFRQDTIFGFGGNDTIFGDNGSDGSAFGSVLLADTIYGGEGDDLVRGENGEDRLFGEAGADTLYGGANRDMLFGGAGDDVLSGGGPVFVFTDSLYGGDGNDTLLGSADLQIAAGQVRLWDGGSAGPIFANFNQTMDVTSDRYFGGADGDTLVLGGGSDILLAWPGDVQGGALAYGGNGPNFEELGLQKVSGIEVVLAGAGNDVVGVNHLRTETPQQQQDVEHIATEAITIAGEGGGDTLIGGEGDDVLWGDALGEISGAPGDGHDFLVGAAGNNTIYGGGGDDIVHTSYVGGLGTRGIDSGTVFGGDGSDTLYGSLGADSLFGGAGDDLIIDEHGAIRGGSSYSGGAGSDILALNLSNVSTAGSRYFISAGPNDTTDGADQVYAGGRYASLTASLGGGNDIFIGESQFDNDGINVDLVSGQAGNDIISAHHGNDVIAGNAGNDALWGGNGLDSLLGGPGNDVLYGGEGDNDQLFGGTGTDYYYWARIDGEGDQIFDEFRGGGVAGQAQNSLVVFAGYDASGTLPAGTGVFETDGTITDSAGGNDMVHAYDIDGAGAGTVWRLEVLQGVGAGNYVEFDQRDIATIELWNHDAPPGTPVVTYYDWDGSTYSLV